MLLLLSYYVFERHLTFTGGQFTLSLFIREGGMLVCGKEESLFRDPLPKCHVAVAMCSLEPWEALGATEVEVPSWEYLVTFLFETVFTFDLSYLPILSHLDYLPHCLSFSLFSRGQCPGKRHTKWLIEGGVVCFHSSPRVSTPSPPHTTPTLTTGFMHLSVVTDRGKVWGLLVQAYCGCFSFKKWTHQQFSEKEVEV